MTFLHPTLLAAGLAAIAVPVLIHLFLRRRRKPVRWAAMRFLIEAYRKHQRRRKIEQILLLLLRCLVVALIAVGVARPLLGDRAETSAVTLAIVIDNGVGSGLVDDAGRTALERHLERADALISALNPARGDRVSIVPAARPVEPLVATPTLDLDSARRTLERLQPASSAADLAGAITAASISAAGQGVGPASVRRRVVVLTEWRRGVTDLTLDANAVPAPAPVELVATQPADSHPANLRVTAVLPGRRVLFPSDTPAAQQTLVTVDRDGQSLPALETSIVLEALTADGAADSRESGPIVFGPGERSATVSVSLPPSSLEDTDAAVRLRLTTDRADDRVADDSRTFLSVRLRQSVRVGVVHAQRPGRGLGEFDSADWLRAALRPEPAAPVEIREMSAPGLDAADLAGLDAAMVTRPDLISDTGWADLATFRDRGGTLILVPPAAAAAHRWTDALARVCGFEEPVSRSPVVLETAEPLAPDAGAPVLPMLSGEIDALARSVAVERLLEITAAPESVVLKTESGRPFLVRPGDRVWLFAAALEPDWTDLPAKPLFVPLVQELARQGAAPSLPANVIAGETLVLPTGTLELVRPETGERVAVDRGGPVAAPRSAGVWIARNARGETVSVVCVSPSPVGGQTAPTPTGEVLEWLRRVVPGVEPGWLDAQASADAPARAGRESHSDWIPFLIAAGLALFELVVARLASHASASRHEAAA